jgi:uncharacterized repeat protein (TIGR01451 family)
VRSNHHGQSLLDDPIDYTIRFQNTGNDTAFQVVIRDTLDVNLDLNTLEITGASHPYEAFLKPDRTLEFRFSNIHLPDSSTNEPGSHGFVSYRIYPTPNLSSPTIIRNTAYIYFDFNGGIQTNTAVNELVDVLNATYHETPMTDLLHAYPIPAKDALLIEAISRGSEKIDYQLRTLDGRPVFTGSLQPGDTQSIPLSGLSSGMYMLQAMSGDKRGSVLVAKL